MDAPILDELRAVLDRAAADVAGPGDWLTGRERIAVWAEVRSSHTHPLDLARREAVSPAAVSGSHAATEVLAAPVVELAHRVASDPGRLRRAWADELIATLGEERYTEVVGVVAIGSVIDRFDLATGAARRPLPVAVDGEPARRRPDGVGDVGAWVSQSVDKTRANVSRTLSLVPVTDATWRSLVVALYSRDDFHELVWDRHLSRPQTELVAGRVTALLECFY